MKEHEFNVRVRYSETDQMGVVYHGNYAQYWDGTRGMAQEPWYSIKWMEESGIMLPVVSLNINYKKPARYDDL
jgi:acyl-CoA thioester hydrolase